ncbi:helix-turn-helix domain-containing protein [Rapidithrix thailandica]|uniref:Helix-turn-helix domain-containing protein n=1 Tax=Rapidithrix thailandica TaxID=413964 RepID=A0AAW9SBP9_9BACT
MNIVIPVYDGVLSSSAIGIYDMLKHASHLHQRVFPNATNNRYLKIQLLGWDSTAIHAAGGITLLAHTTKESIGKIDLIVLPAPDLENLPALMAQPSSWIAWLNTQQHRGTPIASVCLGAFLLAQTGLLTGKSATTHRLKSDVFRMHFPEVRLIEDKIFVEDHDLYTCGGAYAFVHLIIYLIEKYCGKETALQLSNSYLANPNDSPYRPVTYALFGIHKTLDLPSIQKAQHLIEKQIDQKLSVSDLANEVAMSTRTFIRKFKQVTGNTPKEYIQRTKVEKAKQILEMETTTIEQLIGQIGYEDVASFRKIFKKHTGTTPLNYRRQNSRFVLIK